MTKETLKPDGADLHVPFSDGRSCYLRTPDKRILGLAYAKGAKDPLGVADVILANCWVSGDENIKEDVGCLIAIQELANDIAGKVDCEVDVTAHGINILFADLKMITLKKPDRKVVTQALLAARKDPFQMVDVILSNCWDGGHEAVKTSSGHLVSLVAAVDEIIGVKTAEVKKI